MLSIRTGIFLSKVYAAKFCRIESGCRKTKVAFLNGFATLFAAETMAEKKMKHGKSFWVRKIYQERLQKGEELLLLM